MLLIGSIVHDIHIQLVELRLYDYLSGLIYHFEFITFSLCLSIKSIQCHLVYVHQLAFAAPFSLAST